MHIVFPEGGGCVQKPEDLAFGKKVGTSTTLRRRPRTKRTSSTVSRASMPSFSTTRSWTRR